MAVCWPIIFQVQPRAVSNETARISPPLVARLYALFMFKTLICACLWWKTFPNCWPQGTKLAWCKWLFFAVKNLLHIKLILVCLFCCCQGLQHLCVCVCSLQPSESNFLVSWQVEQRIAGILKFQVDTNWGLLRRNKLIKQNRCCSFLCSRSWRNTQSSPAATNTGRYDRSLQCSRIERTAVQPWRLPDGWHELYLLCFLFTRRNSIQQPCQSFL